MPRFITPPDMEFNKSIPKILIRNCDWTGEQIQYLLENLSDKNYDIYLYHDAINDIQWFEGIRGMTPANQVYDCNHYGSQEPLEWLKIIDGAQQ
jgi:hypothetical protein